MHSDATITINIGSSNVNDLEINISLGISE